MVYDRGGDRWSVPAGERRGLAPAWSPTEPVIFLGGSLLSPEGELLEPLLRRGGDALGVWSPEGDRLAVIRGSSLYLFEVGGG